MKNRILYILILTIFASCNSKRNDLNELNLKGDIWKIQETSYEGEEKFGEYVVGDKNYWGHSYYEYNRAGNKTESIRLDDDGEIISVSKYSYDKDDNCITIETFEDDELTQKQINTIDKNKITEVKVFDEHGELSSVYRYTYSGRDISGGSILDKSGEIVNTFINELNKGLIELQIVKDSIGEIIRLSTFNRNKEGDVIVGLTKYPKDTSEFNYSSSYDYDEKRNWIKQYLFDEDGKIEDIIVRNIVYYGDDRKTYSEKDFVGVWFIISSDDSWFDEDDWLEIQENKSFDVGSDSEIWKSGTWETNPKEKVFTLRTDNDDDSRKYKYKFEGSQLIFSTIQGKEQFRLEKK
jgi:hypothetical protein